MSNPARLCPACKLMHPVGTTCSGATYEDPGPTFTAKEVTDMAWRIVKDSKEMRREHPHAYQWARNYLGLEDQKERDE